MQAIQSYLKRVGQLKAKLIGGIDGFFDGIGVGRTCRNKTARIGLRIRDIPILIVGPKAPLVLLVQDGEVDAVA